MPEAGGHAIHGPAAYHIDGLVLDAGQRFRVWDFNDQSPIPITIQSAMTIDSAATLRMVFEDAEWGSTISFEPGITVTLDGTLQLLFADEISPASLIGTTFDLFDWEGVSPDGTFEIVTEVEAVWDTSDLYTTGEVTLLSAVPEPPTLLLLWLGLSSLFGGRFFHRRNRSQGKRRDKPAWSCE